MTPVQFETLILKQLAHLGIFVFLYVICWVGQCITLQKWLRKIGEENSWGAWVPFYSTWLVLKGGDKHWWWFASLILSILFTFVPWDFAQYLASLLSVIADVGIVWAYFVMWKKAPRQGWFNFGWIVATWVLTICLVVVVGVDVFKDLKAYETLPPSPSSSPIPSESSSPVPFDSSSPNPSPS
jgi:hypothetical protein